MPRPQARTKARNSRGPGAVTLRKITENDIPTLFEQQLDPEAYRLVAFSARNPLDRAAHDAYWAGLLRDERVNAKAVVADGQLAGYVVCFSLGPRMLGYWLGRDFWGRGIATAAVREFLRGFRPRPLFAAVAKDNVASVRVLAKCGFVVFTEGLSFSDARQAETDELNLILMSRR